MEYVMIECADMDSAIAIHDEAAIGRNESPMYSSYENVRDEHERLFASHPRLATKWFYEPRTGNVFHITETNTGERLLNKHGLVDSITNGRLHTIIGAPAENHGEGVWHFNRLDHTVAKNDTKIRRGWCNISEENFLSGDLED